MNRRVMHHHGIKKSVKVIVPSAMVVAFICTLALPTWGRTWTSADGAKTFEGDLVSYDVATGTVSVNTPTGTRNFKQAILSAADIAFLKQQGTAPPSSSTIMPVIAKSVPKAPPSSPLVITKEVGVILEDYCYSCHEDGTEKGDIRLDNLTELSLDSRLDLLNRVQEKVYFDEMPPKKKTQPSAEERKQLNAWLSAELHAHDASKLEDKLRYPGYGNAVDHEKLFNGSIKDAPFTPARRWLVSPQIFEQRVLDIFKLEGKERELTFYGVTNPFVLPDASGVRDYDTSLLDGGSLLVMMTNANWISSKQIRPARVKNGEIKATDLDDPKDKWSPRETPAAFETIILKKTAPTDQEITEAIRDQFDRVLRREPSDQELKKYLDLTRATIAIGGNTEGLRQMLEAVLLESEFLYRLEFGASAADSSGRKMLSPREAAYAISYAMGDRGPDATLITASETGKLATREDFKREVERLLKEPTYYKGPIDPSVNGMHLRSQVTSHPKIVRFFREFFGYPNATKVFKDVERGGGYFSNPGRGSLAAPGFMVDEADRVVDFLLQKDQNLFENLLTTDEFFVYHDRSDEEGAKIIKEWREVYEALKNTNWKTDPQKVLDEHIDLIKARPSMRPLDATRPGELKNFMLFFQESFGQGKTPFTTIPWAHGYTFHHAPFYGLLPTPDIGRYGSWKSTKFDPKVGNGNFWDYPVKQPFKIPNRKGILSHPAWLIAHAKNTQNDPVTRGRWVREKLLAGRVPDVPITVDAVIPEDHEKTLRSRLEVKTQEPECMKCHQYMNPLGLPFEIFDDFGRYRTEEFLEYPEKIIAKAEDKKGEPRRGNLYQSLPVNSHGVLDSTGDPKLDGEVTDALDMIGRLAKSVRTRQSIIRYAFRFYMGRNEMLSDSKTLIDADKAYVASGGSFKAVIVSLLTSDSFMYRK